MDQIGDSYEDTAKAMQESIGALKKLSETDPEEARRRSQESLQEIGLLDKHGHLTEFGKSVTIAVSKRVRPFGVDV